MVPLLSIIFFIGIQSIKTLEPPSQVRQVITQSLQVEPIGLRCQRAIQEEDLSRLQNLQKEHDLSTVFLEDKSLWRIALDQNRKEILKWLLEEVYSLKEVVDHLIKADDETTLKYFRDQQLLEEEKIAFYDLWKECVKQRANKIISWLALKIDPKPSQKAGKQKVWEELVKERDYPSLEFLFKKAYHRTTGTKIPTVDGINHIRWAIKQCDKKLTRFFLDHSSFVGELFEEDPDEEGILLELHDLEWEDILERILESPDNIYYLEADVKRSNTCGRSILVILARGNNLKLLGKIAYYTGQSHLPELMKKAVFGRPEKEFYLDNRKELRTLEDPYNNSLIDWLDALEKYDEKAWVLWEPTEEDSKETHYPYDEKDSVLWKSTVEDSKATHYPLETLITQIIKEGKSLTEYLKTTIIQSIIDGSAMDLESRQGQEALEWLLFHSNIDFYFFLQECQNCKKDRTWIREFKDPQGLSLVMKAVHLKRYERLGRLISSGLVDPNISNDQGQTILMILTQIEVSEKAIIHVRKKISRKKGGVEREIILQEDLVQYMTYIMRLEECDLELEDIYGNCFIDYILENNLENEMLQHLTLILAELHSALSSSDNSSEMISNINKKIRHITRFQENLSSRQVLKEMMIQRKKPLSSIFAIENGTTEEEVKRLLANGVNPNQRNRQGQTALMIALKKRQFKIVKLLISQSDLELLDNNNKNIIDIAMSSNCMKELIEWMEEGLLNAQRDSIMKLLIQGKYYLEFNKVLSIYIKELDESSLPHLSKLRKLVQVDEKKNLLEYQKSRKAVTLFELEQQRHIQVTLNFILTSLELKKILTKKPTALELSQWVNLYHEEQEKLKVYYENNWPEFPKEELSLIKDGNIIIVATMMQEPKVVSFLTDRLSLDLMYQDEQGKTALMYALENNDLETIKILAQFKQVDINYKDKEGKTLLMHAIDKGHKEMVVLLVQLGAKITSKPDMISELICEYGDHFIEELALLGVSEGQESLPLLLAQKGYFSNLRKLLKGPPNQKGKSVLEIPLSSLKQTLNLTQQARNKMKVQQKDLQDEGNIQEEILQDEGNIQEEILQGKIEMLEEIIQIIRTYLHLASINESQIMMVDRRLSQGLANNLGLLHSGRLLSRSLSNIEEKITSFA